MFQRFNFSTSHHLNVPTPQLLTIAPPQRFNAPTSQHLTVCPLQRLNILPFQSLMFDNVCINFKSFNFSYTIAYVHIGVHLEWHNNFRSRVC